MRSIFLDFSRLKGIIYEKLKLVNNKQIYCFDLYSEVLEEFSKKYYRQSHRFGRMRILFQELLRDFFKVLFEKSKLYINEYGEKNSIQFMNDRIETIIYNFENRLFQVYSDMDKYVLIEDFDCFLSNWKYYYDNLEDSFKIDITKTCSQVSCNFQNNICSFFSTQKEFIQKTIEMYPIICKKRNIKNIDKKLVESLKLICKFCENRTNEKISLKLCRILGDFYITSVLNDEIRIFTRNKDHFAPLLEIKGLDSMIVLN